MVHCLEDSRASKCGGNYVLYYTGKKMTFFHDPDGLPLEIHE